jgi:diketogulonate reductase-like aldo/keto reductase
MNCGRIGRRDALRLLGAGVITYATTPLRTGRAAEPRGGTSMLTRAIPSSGEALPVIGLGTWQTFDVGSSAAERAPLAEVLTVLADGGAKVIDSSPMYGNSEAVVGDLTSQFNLRPKLFIATKVWTTGRAAGIEQMEASMRKLQANPIDLIEVHNLVDVENQLATLREWKRAGRVRYLGVTHHNAGGHDAVVKVLTSQPIDFVQINYSVGEREAERRILPLAQERGVAVIANRPFAAGDLLRRLRTKPLPAWASEIDCGSWAQILLKFILSHPAITCAIPGTAKAEHMRDNLQAGHGRMPDEKLRARIAEEAV